MSGLSWKARQLVETGISGRAASARSIRFLPM